MAMSGMLEHMGSGHGQWTTRGSRCQASWCEVRATSLYSHHLLTMGAYAVVAGVKL